MILSTIYSINGSDGALVVFSTTDFVVWKV